MLHCSDWEMIAARRLRDSKSSKASESIRRLAVAD
jgi:hypothetical protein